jgi:hypothetical protein
LHSLFKVTDLDTGELFIGPDGVGEGGLVGVPGVLLQGVLLLQQNNLLHLLIWDRWTGQREACKNFRYLGYGRSEGQVTERSYGQLDMQQRQQETGTGYTSRFGQVTEEGHMDNLDMLQRWDTGKGYGDRSQEQVTETGYKNKFHRQVLGAVYKTGTEAGHKDRLQRQVTGAVTEQVTGTSYPYKGRSQGQLQKKVTGTGYRGKSQGLITEAGHRNKLQRQVRVKVVGKLQRKI